MCSKDVVSVVPGNAAPIGPFSPAVKCGGLVYVSGAIGIDPKTGNMISDSLEEQTEQVCIFEFFLMFFWRSCCRI